MKQYIKWLSLLSCIGMFFVLVGGALVTKMDFGRGCGDDWPLCNGKFVPAYTLESLVEYSHRAVSGIVGLLVAVTFIVIWRQLKDRKDAKFYVASSLFFTVLQAIMGAAAVKWYQSSPVMALHFGFSLLAFASTLLLVISLRESRGTYANAAGTVPAGLRRLIWFTTIYCYFVVYLGAFVRHTESFGGCLGWPLCNGAVIPELSGESGIVFAHRVAALVMFLLIILLAIVVYRSKLNISTINKGVLAASVLVILQIASGAWVTFALSNENVYIFAALVHTVFIAAFFAVLCYLSIAAWRRR